MNKEYEVAVNSSKQIAKIYKYTKMQKGVPQFPNSNLF